MNRRRSAPAESAAVEAPGSIGQQRFDVLLHLAEQAARLPHELSQAARSSGGPLPLG